MREIRRARRMTRRRCRRGRIDGRRRCRGRRRRRTSSPGGRLHTKRCRRRFPRGLRHRVDARCRSELREIWPGGRTRRGWPCGFGLSGGRRRRRYPRCRTAGSVRHRMRGGGRCSCRSRSSSGRRRRGRPRQNRRGYGDGSVTKDLRRNRNRSRCHRLGLDKGPRRHHGRRGSVCELLTDDLRRRVAGGRPRSDNRVDLGDADVGDVDVAYVGRVAGIGGPIDLARRQRKPADRRSCIYRDRHGHRDRRRRNKGDECGCIDRHRDELAGHPAPAVVDTSPAPVMTRRKSPGLVVHPVPAPRLDPHPATLAVGCPPHRHRSREPNLAIGRRRGPLSILIELLVAGHRRRDVAGRRQVFSS